MPAPVQRGDGPFLDLSTKLGRRTAEMHLALAADPCDPAFAPEPFTRDDLGALSAEAAALAQRAFQTLDARLQQAGEGSRGPAAGGATGSRRSRTRRRSWPGRATRWSSASSRRGASSSSATRSASTATTTSARCSGPEGDFYLLDFEGEPARPIAERRQKQSPLKDVAGMLRSFSYAAYAALFAHAVGPAGGVRAGSSRGRTSGRRGPRRRSCAATSRPPATRRSCRPISPQRDALLRLFMLDKALYELNYELNNRPDWVRIPLWGIFDLL